VKRFFDLTFKPFFVITGLASLQDLLRHQRRPKWATTAVQSRSFRITPSLSSTGGMIVGLMGAFMVVAAFSAECRNPILIYGAIEKAFLLYLVLINLNRPYAQGFWAPQSMLHPSVHSFARRTIPPT